MLLAGLGLMLLGLGLAIVGLGVAIGRPRPLEIARSNA